MIIDAVTMEKEVQHVFKTTVTMDLGKKGHIKTGNGLELPFSSPPVFHGYDSTLTPEDAFVASVNTCYMLTFAIMCEKLKTDLVEYSCEAEGILNRMEKGGWHFTEIALYPKFNPAPS